MRLKAEVWVKAYLRTCSREGATATVVRHGDDDAGAVFIKIRTLDGLAKLFGPAPVRLDDQVYSQSWSAHFGEGSRPESEIDALLTQQQQYDPDLWIVEVDSRDGRHFLGDWLI
ncbi:MAG: DUF1491 family protein [Hyphomicrobiaceae bacterium]